MTKPAIPNPKPFLVFFEAAIVPAMEKISPMIEVTPQQKIETIPITKPVIASALVDGSPSYVFPADRPTDKTSDSGTGTMIRKTVKVQASHRKCCLRVPVQAQVLLREMPLRNWYRIWCCLRSMRRSCYRSSLFYPPLFR